LDVVGRAIAKSGAHRALAQRLAEQLGMVPEGLRRGLGAALDRAVAFAEDVSRDAAAESEARRAASALYDATRAILMASEAARSPEDARGLLLSRFLLERALAASDPLARGGGPWQEPALDLLLDDAPVPLSVVTPLLQA